MPKRKDIKKILVVGAGPIIIGQACEFDYSGTQACKALKDEGYKVVLINSNPATIMTDPDVADKTYIEPITLDVLEKILKKEKPNAILPTMGGETALNLAMEAKKKGILKKYKPKFDGVLVVIRYLRWHGTGLASLHVETDSNPFLECLSLVESFEGVIYHWILPNTLQVITDKFL